MKLSSCAFTASYKGCYIHQLTDGTFTWQDRDLKVMQAKSWRSAQIAITRSLRESA
jgi:hypothetical protein